MSGAGKQGTEPPVEWHFRSFPVFYAFAGGAFVATLLTPFLGGILFIPALFGVSWGTAHVISRWFQNRSRRQRIEREEEGEKERLALAARRSEAVEAKRSPAAKRRRRRRSQS